MEKELKKIFECTLNSTNSAPKNESNFIKKAKFGNFISSLVNIMD